jgi:glycosyltransferase involved in cell wall biosynthesis
VISRSPVASAGFFVDRSPHGWALAAELRRADLIHLHWVNDLLDYAHVLPRIPASVPVVWTLHDMSPFTGGCCYALDCVRFQTGCGCCPQLASDRPVDLSARSSRRRARALRAIRSRLHLVAPSAWMARMAASSRLFAGLPCAVIPNAVDLACFNPRHREAGRAHLGLAPTTALLLFVAASVSNPVKGMDILLAALPQLQAACPVPLAVACIGSRPEALPAGVRWLGRVTDPEALAALYAAADLLVVPSLIDNAPNVIAEAHACGLPVLASAVGGIPEMVEPGVTGELVQPADSAALATAAAALLPAVMAERGAWSAHCGAAAEGRYAPELVASRHLDLYRHALEQVGGHQTVTPS